MRLKRFTQLPMTLYRIQAAREVRLVDAAARLAGDDSPYDVKTVDGLVLPTKGDKYYAPNGLSLMPDSDNMSNFLKNFKGSPLVFCLPAGLRLPSGLVAMHEFGESWSLQTTCPISLPDLNDHMTKLLDEQVSVTRELYFDLKALAGEDEIM